MRIIIQAVDSAHVEVEGSTVASIKKGMLALVGFEPHDDKKQVRNMISKLMKLRIFSDGEKTNFSLKDVSGSILSISQFTLYADLKGGNRPSFTNCKKADEARDLFDFYKSELLNFLPDAQFGIFQADMKVFLVNDGPTTIILDSKELGYDD